MTATVRATARRRVRRAGLVALASLVAYALLGLPFFVFPAQDPLPAHADVALVLGPATPERLATAARLLDDGVVGHVLVSVPRYRHDHTRPDPEWYDAHCVGVRDTACFLAKPYTTQGEARFLRDQAAEHAYRSAIVITQNAHLIRSRTIVDRCFTGTLTMRESGEPPTEGWPYEYVYQTGATLKSWFVTNSC